MKYPNQNFWDVFKKTDGAFSTPEAIALYNICLSTPQGNYLELGSHKGKSSMAAILGLKQGFFNLVDPIFEDDEIVRGVVSAITDATGGGKSHLNFIANYSTNVINNYENLAYVFVDSGDHGPELLNDELGMLNGRIMSGGILAFHDLDNQFTAVRDGYDRLAASGEYDPIHIDWNEIFDYVRANNLEDGNVSWHERGSEEFPKFVGALVKK